jgi:uncharacterized membrane protein
LVITSDAISFPVVGAIVMLMLKVLTFIYETLSTLTLLTLTLSTLTLTLEIITYLQNHISLFDAYC